MQTYVFCEDLERKEKGREKNLLFPRHLYFFLSHEKSSD